jgi:hypothetical protein
MSILSLSHFCCFAYTIGPGCGSRLNRDVLNRLHPQGISDPVDRRRCALHFVTRLSATSVKPCYMSTNYALYTLPNIVNIRYTLPNIVNIPPATRTTLVTRVDMICYLEDIVGYDSP